MRLGKVQLPAMRTGCQGVTKVTPQPARTVLQSCRRKRRAARLRHMVLVAGAVSPAAPGSATMGTAAS